MTSSGISIKGYEYSDFKPDIISLKSLVNQLFPFPCSPLTCATRNSNLSFLASPLVASLNSFLVQLPTPTTKQCAVIRRNYFVFFVLSMNCLELGDNNKKHSEILKGLDRRTKNFNYNNNERQESLSHASCSQKQNTKKLEFLCLFCVNDCEKVNAPQKVGARPLTFSCPAALITVMYGSQRACGKSGEKCDSFFKWKSGVKAATHVLFFDFFFLLGKKSEGRAFLVSGEGSLCSLSGGNRNNLFITRYRLDWFIYLCPIEGWTKEEPLLKDIV